MTESKNKKKYDGIFLLLVTGSALLLLLCFPDTVSGGVRAGMALCYRAVIPSVFPFMVLSDLLSGCDLTPLDETVGRAFSRIFRIGKRGARAIMMGLICGFPLGVKSVCEEYLSGELSKDEAERLLCFANNTGPAFLIAGIGVNMRKSVSDGVLLLILQLFFAFSVGLLLRRGRSMPHRADPVRGKNGKKVSLTASIQNAALGTLYVTAFITFFSVLASLVRHFAGEGPIGLLLTAPLEIGSAAALAASYETIDPRLSLSVTAFAVCFSGFSVHCQAMVYLRKTDLSARAYFLSKSMCGILAFALMWMISG